MSISSIPIAFRGHRRDAHPLFVLSKFVLPSRILRIHSLTSFSLALCVLPLPESPPCLSSPPSPSRKLSCMALSKLSCSLIADTRRWYIALGPHGERALSISDCL